MFDDPDFAFTYLRPIAVVTGASIGYALAYNWLDRYLERRREKREREMRNVTPRD